jgi:HEAT repeat protein
MVNTVPKVVQIASMTAVGFVPFGGSVYMFLQMACHDTSTASRVAAAAILANDPSPEAHDALVKALSDKQPAVQAAAIEALALRNDLGLLPRVEAMLLDSDATAGTIASDKFAAFQQAVLEGAERESHAILAFAAAAAYLRLIDVQKSTESLAQTVLPVHAPALVAAAAGR